MATRIPIAITTGTDFTELQIGDTCSIPGSLSISGTLIMSVQAALSQWGGSPTPGAAAAAPAFNQYDSCSIFGGSSNARPLPSALVAAPTITYGGTTGATVYQYCVSAVMADGITTTAALNIGFATTGNATLTATNKINITWAALTGATSYLVYRSSGGTSTGLIGTTSGLTLSDTGLTATGTVPLSTTLIGEYWHNGNWTQISPISCLWLRLHIYGNLTVNGNWIGATETLGGLGSLATSGNVTTGGTGAGPGGGSNGCGYNTAVALGGGGGGFGGAGGRGATTSASNYVNNGGATYSFMSCLSGSGGGGGSGGVGGGGNGGGGGGSILLEVTGTLTFTSTANMTANGATGSTGGGNWAGGGGSGGGIDIRAFGAVSMASGANILANGGNGGNAPNVGGGGGGGGVICISGPTISNSGTVAANGGSVGTGSFGAAGTAGGTGQIYIWPGMIRSLRSAG